MAAKQLIINYHRHSQVGLGDGEEPRSLLQILRTPPVDWEAFLTRLANHPEEAGSYLNNFYTQSRLQRVLEVNSPPAPAEVVRALLDANRDAAYSVDRNGRTALRYACRYGRSPEVIKMLLKANPIAVSRASVLGTIPLHDARTVSIARMLLNAYPHGMATPDNRGMIPLHHAAFEPDCEPGVFRLLLEAGQNEEGLQDLAGGALARDARGITPLDSVSSWIASAMLEVRIGRNGMYPFMLAAVGSSSINTVYMLLRESPALMLRNNFIPE